MIDCGEGKSFAALGANLRRESLNPFEPDAMR
jgi:hypothetical protein